MSYRIARSAVSLFVAAAGTLFFAADHAPAQCQKSGQTGTTSSTGTSSTSSGTALTNTAQRQGRGGFLRQQAAGQNSLRQQQVAAFQQQLALQQQIALQNALLQQQLTGVQQQPPAQQQSMLGIGRQRQQPQFQRVASTDPAPLAGNAVPAPEDPEDAAARQLGIARALAADAETASKAGKEELSTTLRLRAAERIQRILSKYADTRAADGAQELMRKIQ